MTPRIRALAAELRDRFGREDGVLRVVPADHAVVVYLDGDHPAPPRLKNRIDGIPVVLLVPSEETREKLTECPCKISMRIMAALGATHSAKMHAAPLAAWKERDWLQHFDEEERIILPLLHKRGLHREAEKILEEHRVFRRYLSRYGHAPEEALGEHAAFEDWLSSTYLSDLDPEHPIHRGKRAKNVARLHALAR